jgi:hypothetical protein
MIYITRKTKALDRYAEAFSDMLVSVLHGGDLRTAVELCQQKLDGNSMLGRATRYISYFLYNMNLDPCFFVKNINAFAVRT